MGNDVIYEEPKLGFWRSIRRWWDTVYIAAEGFTDEYFQKMEAKKNEEKKQLQGAVESGAEVLKESVQQKSESEEESGGSEGIKFKVN